MCPPLHAPTTAVLPLVLTAKCLVARRTPPDSVARTHASKHLSVQQKVTADKQPHPRVASREIPQSAATVTCRKRMATGTTDLLMGPTQAPGGSKDKTSDASIVTASQSTIMRTVMGLHNIGQISQGGQRLNRQARIQV